MPQTTIEAVIRSIKDSGRMPAEMSYLGYAPDVEGDDSDVTLPLIAVRPMYKVRLTPHNSDFKEYKTDSQGNHIGRIYASEYRLDLEVSIWTAAGSSYDVDDLGNDVRLALYKHDSSGPGLPLERSDGSPIEAIWKARVEEGQPSNDLTYTPALRRWREELTLWAYHEFDTTEDYVATVSYPADGEMTDENDNDVVSNVSDGSTSEF